MTAFEQIGGTETCERLSKCFHNRVAGDSALRAIFPKSLTATTERFALFIAERLGGPAGYSAKRGKQSLRCRHAHLSIGTSVAEAWLGHMFEAVDEVGIVEPVRQYLREYFADTAQTLRDPFLALYRLPLDELIELLKLDPSQATAADMGRTLLGEAAGRWDLPRVQVLLQRGANANAESHMEHGPLYRAANALAPASEADGIGVAELLIRYGADVDWRSGPVRCTPLHMTARRGHVALAKVLLDAGADIEKADSKGETPLRRAVNCSQKGMVTFLLSRGANPLSRDKQGRTPLTAVRQEPIRQALQEAARGL